MKRIHLLLLALLSYATLSNGQSNQEILAYLDKDREPVTDPTKTADVVYYRTALEIVGCCFLVREFDLYETLRMEAECSALEPRLIRDGKVTYYHANGTLDNECIYKNDRRTGIVRYLYPSGMLKAEIDYSGDKTRYIQVFSETGEALLINGNGTVTDPSSTKGISRKITDHIPVGDFYITSTKDTVYTELDKLPEYAGGYPQLMRDIAKTIKYPANARRKHLSGTSYIAFTVTKDGRTIDFEVVSGFDAECDAEALRVMRKVGPWTPGEYQNKTVITRFVMPIKFKAGT